MPYGAGHTQPGTRRAKNVPNRGDELLAPPGTMKLREALERKLESHEIIRIEQRRNRQLCKLGGSQDNPRELLLDVPGNL